MAVRTKSQRSFLRGVQPVFQDFSRPEGAVARISNLVYSKRAALKTVDGTLIQSAASGLGAIGAIEHIAFLNFVGQIQGITQLLTQLYIIQRDSSVHFSTPTLAGSLIAGRFAAGNGTYYYQLTPLDGAGGEGLPSAEISVTITNSATQSVSLTWAAIPGAISYNLYGRVTGATKKLLATIVVGTGSGSFTDDGTMTPQTQPLPGSDTTESVAIRSVTGSTYSGSLLTLPGAKFSGLGFSLGGFGGSTESTPSLYVNPSGGIAGQVGPLPYGIQFQTNLVFLLGNGQAPRLLTYPSTLTALANTFSGGFPTWAASTAYNFGAIVNASPGNGHLYRAIQAGTSSAAAPTFPTGTGAIVSDGGQLIWEEAGSNSIVAPRGAAHAAVHFASLWLWNTYPTTTADLLDGPSCLKMSDINNPNSWNPLNTAFVAKDDGQQGTGMATFSIAEAGIAPVPTIVLFKDFSTYLVNGIFGASNFSISQAPSDMGNIAPRSIQFLPHFGIIRLAHLGVAVFDGVEDRLLKPEQLRPYLFGGVPDIVAMDWSYAYLSKSAQAANPPAYVLAIPLIGTSPGLSRILIFDISADQWTVVDLPFSIQSLAFLREPGTIELTYFGDHSSGNLRRWMAGDADWDGTAIKWNVKSEEVFSEPGRRNYYRRVFIRGVIPSGVITLTAVVNLNGLAGASQVAAQYTLGAGQFEAEVPIGLTGMNANLNLSGSGQIELDSFDWHVAGKPAGVPARIMRG